MFPAISLTFGWIRFVPTTARSKTDVQGRDDGGDDEYETCDEEDLAGNRCDIEKHGSMPQTVLIDLVLNHYSSGLRDFGPPWRFAIDLCVTPFVLDRL